MTPFDIGLLSIAVDASYVPFAQMLEGRRLIVYGCGGLFSSFDSFVLRRYGITPDCIIDRKFADSPSSDRVGPDSFFDAEWSRFSPTDLVIICLGDSQAFQETQQRFAERGFVDVRSAYAIYEYNLIYADEAFAQDPVALYRREWDKLSHVYNVLQDPLSRDTFYKFLRTHVERKPPDFAPASYPFQYTPPDLKLINQGIRLLNCGAYTGDTIETFIRNYGTLDLVVALEPDPDNFEKLTQNRTVREGSAANILLPLGASDQNASCLFEQGHGMISRVSHVPSPSATLVRTVKLDSVFQHMHFNKVVIDTEGHEKEILAGMEHIIRTDGPDICVACYHHPEDIYQIALLIESYESKYKFYLRNHSSVCVDTVLYATLQ